MERDHEGMERVFLGTKYQKHPNGVLTGKTYAVYGWRKITTQTTKKSK
jgi:hypothetical protein